MQLAEKRVGYQAASEMWGESRPRGQTQRAAGTVNVQEGEDVRGEEPSPPEFWKGRWAAAFAVGEGDRMLERISATSNEAL